jgi:uncharacterized protein YjiS (DUF1127 family)
MIIIRRYSQLEDLYRASNAPTEQRRSAWQTLTLWVDRARIRKELAGLTVRQLDDAGLDPEQIRLECRKPFWRA